MGTETDIPGGTSLKIEVYGVLEPFKGTLIGIETGVLIIRIPSESFVKGLKRKLYKGNSAVVNYSASNCSYKFDSVLLGNISDPLNLVFIKKPEKIETDDHRASERIECHIPGKIKTEDNEFKGVVQNISKNGCKCCLTQSSSKDRMTLLFLFEEGKNVNISLDVPEIGEDFQLAGKMRHLNSSAECMTFGVEFDTLPPELLEKVEEEITGKKSS